MFELPGKTALVTGAAKRLGKAVAIELARAGCSVIVHYNRSRDDAEDTAASIRKLGVDAWIVQADFSDPDSIEHLFDAGKSIADRMDFLVNSASVFPSDSLWELTESSLFENVRINALAPFILSRRFSSQCEGGCIVNLLDARILDYDKHHVPYHLSKRMLFTLTRMMSIEFAPRIRVNAVAPGLILPPPGEDKSYLEKLKKTNLLGAVGSPEQISSAVLFLLWNEFITGQIIYVDGGRHIKGRTYGS